MARIVVPRADSAQTRDKILSAAERLFAVGGFDGVSIRQVGEEADVPFALVTYHFKSKLGLYKAVFERRSAAISIERIERLRAIELRASSRANFNAFARAFVEPLMRMRDTEGGRDFARIIAREFHDPVKSEVGIVEEYLDPVAAVAIDVLRKMAPDAPVARVYWAFHFAIGALLVNHSDTGRLERISGGRCKPDNVDELIEELSRFMAAGLLGSLQADVKR